MCPRSGMLDRYWTEKSQRWSSRISQSPLRSQWHMYQKSEVPGWPRRKPLATSSEWAKDRV